MSVEKESNWINNHLMTCTISLLSKGGTRTTQELSIDKDDIMRFLEFMHVQKLDVSTISVVLKKFYFLF